jgi:3-methyladenine DNA glycosylase AlkD
VTASPARRLEAKLRASGDAARAEQERRYLKSELEHYGASVPAVRGVVKGALADRPTLSHDELIELVEELWARPVHECRVAAVELLELRSDLLLRRDIELIERLIRESRTWALVDGLAAGPLVERHPALGATLDRWAVDDDFWLRRSALLALLLALRRGEGDFERFGRYADQMLDEREFFIRKAIGWVFRDTSRRRPDLVYAWLAPRAERASGVTLHEAVKHLSADQRDRILTRRGPAENHKRTRAKGPL